VAEDVTVDKEELLVELILEALDAACRAQQLRFKMIVNVNTQPAPVAQIVAEYVRKMVEIDKKFRNSVLPKAPDVPLDHGHTQKRQHGLGSTIRERA
jgi:hypothetical protein